MQTGCSALVSRQADLDGLLAGGVVGKHLVDLQLEPSKVNTGQSQTRIDCFEDASKAPRPRGIPASSLIDGWPALQKRCTALHGCHARCR